MEFTKELIWALGMATFPVAIFTMAIVWWATRNGHLDNLTDSKSIRLKLKALSKEKVKKGEQDKRDFVHKKWSKFGGGFYGVVALLTYIVVEARELIDMVVHIGGFIEFIQHLDFGVIISMFISAIMNFVYAMAWPWYWITNIDTKFIWLWFIAAYAGYWGGMKIVLMRMSVH